MTVLGPPRGQGEALLRALHASGLATLGCSREGRAIVGRVFGGIVDPTEKIALDSAPRRLLVVGGVHGDEPSSVEAVWDLAGRIGRVVPPWELVLVVPVLNPDGLLVGRKNAASDVDLNRNFPAANFTRAHRDGYDPGPFPLSEPETALLARLCDDHAIDAVVAVHAPFACVNFDGPARTWAETVAAACGWPVREHIGYSTPGSLGSWLGVDRRFPVLTLELPAGPLESFRKAASAALDAAIAR